MGKDFEGRLNIISEYMHFYGFFHAVMLVIFCIDLKLIQMKITRFQRKIKLQLLALKYGFNEQTCEIQCSENYVYKKNKVSVNVFDEWKRIYIQLFIAYSTIFHKHIDLDNT